MTVPTVERGFSTGGLLLDGDRRRQPLDVVDIRLLHHLEELPRIGRQALDIAPLALGIDRVEGERGLAGAGQPGEHDERVARDRQVDVLEIVLARAADGDGFAVVAHDLVRFTACARPQTAIAARSAGCERSFLAHDQPRARIRVNDCPQTTCVTGANLAHQQLN